MMGNHPDIAIKIKVVKAYKNGNSITHLSNVFGYHRNTIRGWIQRYPRKEKLLRSKNPGSGRPSTLNRGKGKELIRILKQPASKYGFETDFWTTSRILIVCDRELKSKVSRMTVFRTLKKYEYSYKKPQKRYYEADTKLQKKWLKSVAPKIKKLVREKRAILYFEDESNILLAPVLGKTWSPIGKRTIQKVTGNRGSVSAISAISSSGKLIFNLHDSGKRFNSWDIIGFLSQMLLHHKNRHIVVVMDNATCHTSKMVASFIQKQRRLHVFFFPPRSPEFNPDEQVWAHLKHHELKSHKATSTHELKKLAKAKLNGLSKNQKKLKGIFKRCDYAKLFC